MPKIRPEQQSHAHYLRRGNGPKAAPFVILAVAGICAVVGVFFAL